MALLAPTRNKLGKFINHKVKVVLRDKRYFIGQMLAFDSHSNVVIKDCEEFRKNTKRKSGEPLETKRNLGLMLLRGDSVMRIDVIGPPPASLPKPPGLSNTNTAASLLQTVTKNNQQKPNNPKNKANTNMPIEKQPKPILNPNSLPQ